MGYNLLISERANDDVDDIAAYLALKLANPPAAAAFLERLAACYERLEQNPMLYALTPHPILKALGVRRAPIGGYGVFYRVDSEGVHIIRILSDREALEGKLY